MMPALEFHSVVTSVSCFQTSSPSLLSPRQVSLSLSREKFIPPWVYVATAPHLIVFDFYLFSRDKNIHIEDKTETNKIIVANVFLQYTSSKKSTGKHKPLKNENMMRLPRPSNPAPRNDFFMEPMQAWCEKTENVLLSMRAHGVPFSVISRLCQKDKSNVKKKHKAVLTKLKNPTAERGNGGGTPLKGPKF
jgi:hypothetical protein